MLHKPGDPPIQDVDGLINFEACCFLSLLLFYAFASICRGIPLCLQVNTDGTEGDGPYVGIKSPMFSWKRLLGADPTLVDMLLLLCTPSGAECSECALTH